MAEVFVAAAMSEEAQARGLAEALRLLGFDAASGAPAENDIAATAEGSKCVLVLWSRTAAAAPWLTALAVLAQERKKLISAEAAGGTTPGPFKTAPRVELPARDRTKFKARFEALVVEIDKLTPTKGDAKALPDALAKARAALLQPSQPEGALPPWRTLGAFALAVGVLFAVGFGAGRVLNAVRSGELLVATTTADAAPAQTAAVIEEASEGFNWRVLERQPWRDAAARLTDADGIKRRALTGDAQAQTMACLGHMAGVEGFLPSPTAAREFCDAAAEQHEPGGLYLSWMLHRPAPHAGIGEREANERLAEAARLGWSAAQVDYALMLAPDARAPLEAQGEAGRLWLAASEAGDPRGQYFYARWLRDSRAGPRDPIAAVPYLERAVNGGQPEAQHMLATLYRDGIGVERNAGRARALYEQAARQHHAPSMFNLADMLRQGGREDRARAVELYKQLACMRDELQIQPLAVQRLRALQERADCR